MVQFPEPFQEGCTVEEVFYDHYRQAWTIILSHPTWPEVDQIVEIYEHGCRFEMRKPPAVQGEWLAQILTPGAKVFSKAKEGDAGYDIFVTGYMNDKAVEYDDYILCSGQSMLFMTGIATSFPKTHVGLVLDRSGYGVKGIMRRAGVIDSNWRGEWGVCLYNTSPHSIKIESVVKHPNAKAACQVVFVECSDHTFQVVDKLPPSIRGDAWQGSSDKR